MEGKPDAEAWQHTQRAMGAVGVTEGGKREIVSALAAVLHLGNVAFDSDGAAEACSVSGPTKLVARSVAADGSLSFMGTCRL